MSAAGDRPGGEGRAPIRRIVVALDSSADSRAALRASAELAAALGAELVGLYVEDVDLLRVTGRAPATEIDILSGRPRRLVRRDLERQLRAQAARARRALERIAELRALRWSFRTARGRVSAELLRSGADLITLGVRGHAPGRGPGSTVRRLLAATGAPVMVIHRAARLGGPVHVLHDGGEAGDRAVRTAAELAAGSRVAMTVLVASGAGEESGEEGAALGRAADRVRELTGDVDTAGITVHPVAGEDPESLAAAVEREPCGLLVLPRSGPVAALRMLLRRTHCPILVVD